MLQAPGVDAAARYRKVYAVDGAVVPEDLDEPAGFDGKVALLDAWACGLYL